jgi:nucleotide-binding universal stress UspA family protein
MKNILVLTDFSGTAYQALFYISRLMKHREACFQILNTFSENTPLQGPGIGQTMAKPLSARQEEESWESLRRTAHKIRLDQQNPKHEFRTMVRQDTLAGAVSKILREQAVDLVVMGNKGTSAVKNVFLGSNALRIIGANLKCPILLVPEEAGEEIPMEIAFATDYNQPYYADVLKPLIFISKLCSAAIRIVHINEEARLSPNQLQHLDKLKDIFGQTAHTLHWMPDFRTKTLAIHSFIQKHHMGMLAMVRHRHDFLAGLQHEPVIRKIQFMVEVPFLILPDREGDI